MGYAPHLGLPPAVLRLYNYRNLFAPNSRFGSLEQIFVTTLYVRNCAFQRGYLFVFGANGSDRSNYSTPVHRFAALFSGDVVSDFVDNLLTIGEKPVDAALPGAHQAAISFLAAAHHR